MKKAKAWEIVQTVTKGFAIDQEALVDSGARAWGPGREAARPEQFEAWVRRCLSRARQPGVRNPVGLFLDALAAGPDRDLSVDVTDKAPPKQNAAAYEDWQGYKPTPESEPDWSLTLSIEIYQWVAYHGRKPAGRQPMPALEDQNAGMAAVRLVIAEWIKAGRPGQEELNWKNILKEHAS